MSKVIVIRSKLSEEPPDQPVDSALTSEIENTLADFAGWLECARVFWRSHRTLVEASTFPEQLRTIYLKANGCEPDERIECWSPIDTPARAQQFLALTPQSQPGPER